MSRLVCLELTELKSHPAWSQIPAVELGEEQESPVQAVPPCAVQG